MSTVSERDICRSMMLDTEQWPQWPVLPLKRRKTDGTWPDMGVLLDPAIILDPDRRRWTEFTVFECNMLELPKTVGELSDVPQTEYIDVDAVLDAGWVVD